MSSYLITIAAKCAPVESLFQIIEEAGLSAVELYIDSGWLKQIKEVSTICKKFSFRYAVHAPANGYEPDLFRELVSIIKPEIIVFHDIYWGNEWDYIIQLFRESKIKLCVENVRSSLEPFKLMRRYGTGYCLDLEHLQLEMSGIYEEDFLRVMKLATHVHLTGYSFGTNKWHTPIHYAPEQSKYLIDLLKKVNYSGLVVSEARVLYQTREEFIALARFFEKIK